MKLNSFKIVKSNIIYYKFRTVVLILIIILLTFSFIVSDTLKGSFNNSIDKVDNMLGADIIIAPLGVDKELQDSLFVGKPSSFVFNAKKLDGITEIENIESVSSQLLLSTFNADCCDTEIQMISIDYSNDSSIKAWLENKLSNLNDDEIIVGADVAYKVNQGAKFFNKTYKVVGKLKKTEMGYDNSVFVNKKTGEELAQTSNNYNEDVSMTLIKVKDKKSIENTCEQIMDIINDNSISVYRANYLYTEINNEIMHMSFVINFFMVIIAGLFVCAFISIVLLTTNERKRELATYLLIGYSEIQRMKILVFELVIIVLIGTLIGFVLSILFLSFFENYLTFCFLISFNFSIIEMVRIYIMILVLTIAVSVGTIFYMIHKLREVDYNYLKK